MRSDARALSTWCGTRQPATKQEIGHRPVSNRAALSLLALLTGPFIPSRAAEQPPLPDELAVTDSIVMTDRDEFVEIQGTAERSSFNTGALTQLLDLGRRGICELIDVQRKTLQFSQGIHG